MERRAAAIAVLLTVPILAGQSLLISTLTIDIEAGANLVVVRLPLGAVGMFFLAVFKHLEISLGLLLTSLGVLSIDCHEP
jgi:hypothetical protein